MIAHIQDAARKWNFLPHPFGVALTLKLGQSNQNWSECLKVRYAVTNSSSKDSVFSSPINTTTWIGVVFHQSKGIPTAQLLWQPLERKKTCSHYRTSLHTPNHKHIRSLISKLLHSFTTLIMHKQLFHSAT